MLPFRHRLTLEQRRAEHTRIQRHCQDRIPVVVEAGSRDTRRSDKEKFLVPLDLTTAQLTFVLRKRIGLQSGESLFLLVNGTLAPSSTTMSEFHQRHVGEDGFLYVVYTTENAFGGMQGWETCVTA